MTQSKSSFEIWNQWKVSHFFAFIDMCMALKCLIKRVRHFKSSKIIQWGKSTLFSRHVERRLICIQLLCDYLPTHMIEGDLETCPIWEFAWEFHQHADCENCNYSVSPNLTSPARWQRWRKVCLNGGCGKWGPLTACHLPHHLETFAILSFN